MVILCTSVNKRLTKFSRKGEVQLQEKYVSQAPPRVYIQWVKKFSYSNTWVCKKAPQHPVYIVTRNYFWCLFPQIIYSNGKKFPIYSISFFSQQHPKAHNLTFVPCQKGVDRELGTLPPAVVLPCRTRPQALLRQVAHSWVPSPSAEWLAGGGYEGKYRW